MCKGIHIILISVPIPSFCSACNIEQLRIGLGTRLHAHYTLHINKYRRSELQVIQEKLKKEGMSKNDIIQELEALREKHQNEILAKEHARKLSK